MKVLKTYARYFTDDVDATLVLLGDLLGRGPDYRFSMKGFEVVGIGDVCVVGGPDEALAPVRDSLGPFIVDDLDAAQALLERNGAELIHPATDVETGRMFFARHPDGAVFEYVEWKPDLAERLIPGR